MQLQSATWYRGLLSFLFVAVVAGLVPGGRAGAQVLDSKGREFWVAFLANWGSKLGSETSDLRIYLSCDRPTTVTIAYTATGDSKTIPLPTANSTVEVNVNALFGDFVELDDVFGSNEITPKSLHVSCADEISLYGANIRSKSADAFLGLPADVLTGRYIVLAYPNGYNDQTATPGYDMPSEFCIVATEDGTNVGIKPSPGLTINGRAAAPFQVSMNRGDVFFGQADISSQREQDVSGTEISANKPVAVFGGNKRTSIPTRVGNYRDHLCEQLPPLDAWGKGALLTPHFKVTPESGDTAVARILAAFPGTDVTVTRASGPQTFSLGPGISIEVALTEPMTVSASQPILVAQYEHSVSFISSGFDIGDPFMMLIPPSEQFDTAYAFQSIIHPEFVNQHYVNVVIPAAASATVRLDGVPLGGGISFQPIPGSRYAFAQVKVGGGSHYIHADSAFGLYAYGFGSATSYGYPGGMLFRRLVSDFEPPEVAWEQWCRELKGYAYDSRITDTGIDSCYATKDTQNVVVLIDPFKPGDDTVAYRAHLIDPYQDGVVGVIAIDSGGRSRSFAASIPGFTLRVANTAAAPALLDTFVVLNSTHFCRSIQIRNYGKFKQKITRAELAETLPAASIDPAQFPLEILPGGFAAFDICFDHLADTTVTVTLDISGDCGSRRVAMVPIDNRVDTTAPSFGLEGKPCGDDFLLTYYESIRSAGIASVEFDSTENCTVENLIDPTKLPARLVQVKLHRLDPRKEIVFVVTLRDAAGNSVIKRDTIGGFTLGVIDRSGDTIGVRYDRGQEGDSLALYQTGCDSVRITNYGSRPITVDRVVMRGNRLYSVPPSQFPIVIGPKEARRVTVCVEGHSTTDMTDTLVIVDECGHEELVMLKNAMLPLSDSGKDGCGNAIAFNTYAPAKRAFLTVPVPNPAGGSAIVDVGLTHDDDVTIEIYSAGGRPVMSVVREATLKAGISRVTFDVSALDNGAYFCRMTTAAGTVIVEKMIVRR